MPAVSSESAAEAVPRVAAAAVDHAGASRIEQPHPFTVGEPQGAQLQLPDKVDRGSRTSAGDDMAGTEGRLIVGTLRDLQIKFTERFAQAPPILIERFLAPVMTAQHEHTVQCIGARVSLFDRSNRRSN